MKNFTKNCIYIGKGYKKDFGEEIYIRDSDIRLSCSELNFGRTGKAFYVREKRKWDFRPDGLNIEHLVDGKDLHFEGDRDKYNYPI